MFSGFKTGIAIVLATGCSPCAFGATPQASTDAILPYASIKRPQAAITRRDSAAFGLPVPIPHKGVLLSNGSFLAPGASFTIVDFDARSITRLTTVLDSLPDGKRELSLTGKTTRTLDAAELNRLIDNANKVWDPPPDTRPGSPMVLDATCNIVLFDGDDMLNQWGFACPYNSQNLIAALSAIKLDWK